MEVPQTMSDDILKINETDFESANIENIELKQHGTVIVRDTNEQRHAIAPSEIEAVNGAGEVVLDNDHKCALCYEEGGDNAN